MTAAARHGHTEERLRAALEARARLVQPGRLRPSVPPAAPAAARLRLRRGAAVLVALAAAVAGAVLWLGHRHQDTPAPPAGPPSVTGPRPPAPAPAAPSAVPRSPDVAAPSPR